MDIQGLYFFVRRWWWLLLIGAAVAGLTTYVLTQAGSPLYRTSATLMVLNRPLTPGEAEGGLPAPTELNELVLASGMVEAYADMVLRPVILEEVSRQIGGERSVGELFGALSVWPSTQTQMITITSQDADPALAASMANLTASTFIQENAREIGQPGTVLLTQPAQVPTVPLEESSRLILAFGTLAGLAIAVVIARGLEQMDDSLQSREAVGTTLGLPVLGVIGESHVRRQITAAGLEGDSRELWAFTQALLHEPDLRAIAVTNQEDSESRTGTAVALAQALAHTGRSVILVDADVEEPKLHRVMRTPASKGLTGVLADRTPVASAVVSSALMGVSVLPAGEGHPGALWLLGSDRMMALLKDLEELADFVVVDCASFGSSPYGYIAAGQVGTAVVTVDLGRSRSGQMQEALAQLNEAKVEVLGVIVNKNRPWAKLMKDSAPPSGRRVAFLPSAEERSQAR